MIDLPLLLTYGAILSVIAGAIVSASFIYRPRIWIRDFPADIGEMADPMTEEEKRLALKIGLLVVTTMLVILVLTALGYGFDNGFLLAALHTYLVFQIFNAFDIVIDWVALWLIDPANPPIPGTENAPGWSNYSFHAIASLKGSVIGVPFALLATGMGWLIWSYAL
ncbi:MAG: hypothetical protein AAGE86_02260 [Pseudomonadota bacterium]